MSKNKKNKRVLITGGMGFIGRALTRKLLKETDYLITIIDNLSTCKEDGDICNNPRIQFINTDLDEWHPNNGDNFDYLYHLAGPVGPVRVLDFSGQIAKIIINHLYKVAGFASRTNAKLMFISTSEVYGTHAKKKMSEDVNPIVPSEYTVRLEYGMGKLMGEIMLANIARVKPLKYNCVRPFNIIGPGQNEAGGFVVPRFIRKALNNEPITVYGDGKMIRTFTHINDFVDAIAAITESDISGEVFNVGNPKNTMSILDLAKHIKKATGSKCEIKMVDPKKLFGKDFEEAWDKIPDISKLDEKIGWRPKWGVKEIMNEIRKSKNDYLVN